MPMTHLGNLLNGCEKTVTVVSRHLASGGDLEEVRICDSCSYMRLPVEGN